MYLNVILMTVRGPINKREIMAGTGNLVNYLGLVKSLILKKIHATLLNEHTP